MKVAIIIPTINRPDFLNRQLRYYASVSCQHTIYIGDSSDNQEDSNKNQQTVKSYANQLSIKYFQFPGQNDLQTIYNLLTVTTERYAAFIADDDLLVPISLSTCATFLENNPKYRMVSGVSLLSSIQNDGAYGPINGLSLYKQLSLEANSASERLINYMSNYFVTLFYVHHTNEFMKHIKLATSIPDKGFRELLSCCSSIINGNAYVLNQLHMVRQTHSARYFLPDPIDWISNPDWSESYHKSANLLSNQLQMTDNISEQKANEIVKTAFWSYFSKDISVKLRERSISKTRLSVVLKSKIKESEVVYLARKLVRKLLPFSNQNISIDTILNNNSPHREQFQNIYNSINEPPTLSN